ncbi:hypothetical protein EXIGLDRAFT_757773, partial [Exidia glandulosa HHB12029]
MIAQYTFWPIQCDLQKLGREARSKAAMPTLTAWQEFTWSIQPSAPALSPARSGKRHKKQHPVQVIPVPQQPLALIPQPAAFPQSTFAPILDLGGLTLPRVTGPSSSETPTDAARATEQKLWVETHQNAAAIAEERKGKTTTAQVYGRWLKDYEFYFTNYQVQRSTQDPDWHQLPPMPITATKVMVFLQWCMTRPQKRKRQNGEADVETEYIQGTNLGKSSIQQIISALEDHRKSTSFRYLGVPEAQIPLRTDIR